MVDTAPGLGEHVLATLEQATDAVWICGMDVPSIRGMRTGFQILEELNLVPEQRHIVLNMADRRAGLTLKDVEATVGAPVDVVLPRSKNLPFSTNKGVPVLQDGSRDPASKGSAPAGGALQARVGSKTAQATAQKGGIPVSLTDRFLQLRGESPAGKPDGATAFARWMSSRPASTLGRIHEAKTAAESRSRRR